MIITYQGANAFKLQSGETVVLIDPENQRSFKGAAIVVRTTEPALSDELPHGEGTPFFVSHQGEYDVDGVLVRGMRAGYENGKELTVYRIVIDDIAIAIVGHLTHALDPKVESLLHSAAIALVPAGGKPYLTPSAAAALARQIEPSIVIPSLYTDVTPFARELGVTQWTPEEKIVVKRKDLSPKALSLRVLTA